MPRPRRRPLVAPKNSVNHLPTSPHRSSRETPVTSPLHVRRCCLRPKRPSLSSSEPELRTRSWELSPLCPLWLVFHILRGAFICGATRCSHAVLGTHYSPSSSSSASI